MSATTAVSTFESFSSESCTPPSNALAIRRNLWTDNDVLAREALALTKAGVCAMTTEDPKAAAREAVHPDLAGKVAAVTGGGRGPGSGTVVKLVAFLASDSSRCTTGQAVVIDGGHTLV